MADLFFRGLNRTDTLYTLMLQTAFDAGADSLVQQIADQLGFVSLSRHDLGVNVPPCGVLVTTNYVFLLTGSTRNVYQWLYNLLGSAAVPAPLSHGHVAAYFYAVALAQYGATRSEVIAALSGRRLVLCGFSLGAASITILKDILKLQNSVDSAAFAPASPRVGLQDFATGYPVDNFNRYQFIWDVVPGVPPTTWAGTGSFFGWTPFPPLVTYVHVGTGSTLQKPDVIATGDFIPPLSYIVGAFNIGNYASAHDPSLYGVIIRGGMPTKLEDGFDGYPNASSLDSLAFSVFTSSKWPWFPVEGFTPMSATSLVQVNVCIRDVSLVKGYQEVYFYNSSDPQAIFNAFALGGFGILSGTRAAFLSKSCEIYALRVAAVSPAPRQSLLQKFTPTFPGAVGVDETEIDNDLTFFLYSGTRTYKRQIHYGGVPNTWIDGDQLTPAGLAAIPLIDTWISQLLGKGNLIIKTPTYNQTAQVLAVTKDPASGELILQLDNVYNIPANSLINITKCRGVPLLRGNWLTYGTGGVAAGTTKLIGSSMISPPIGTTATMRTFDPTFGGGVPTVASQVFNGASVRKRGRPLFQARGRRSAIQHRR